MISSAYRLAEIIERDYPSEQWNIYPFHFSDGDNWSVDDTLAVRGHSQEAAPARVERVLLRPSRQPYGSGQFIKDLKEHFSEDEQLITSEINDRDAIVESIREFSGEGQVAAWPSLH